MQQTGKFPSKLRIILTWSLMVGVIAFWIVFWCWRGRSHPPEAEPASGFSRSIFMLIVGGFFLVAGIVSYTVVILSDCFTYNFNRPVWGGVKAKIYVANILVSVLLSLGLGFGLSAFLSPVLAALGLEAGVANLLPVMVMLGLVQIVQLWVLIWSPLEKRLITKRLLTKGISAGQLKTAVLIGLSNPASGFIKRFGAIEEDMGALWIDSSQLIYWGDGEQFSILRDQFVQMERKADTRSTTMLSGIAHVVLHVRLAQDNVRQIRLHTEGLWTMGQKRRAMDALADRIASWQNNPVPLPPPIP